MIELVREVLNNYYFSLIFIVIASALLVVNVFLYQKYHRKSYLYGAIIFLFLLFSRVFHIIRYLFEDYVVINRILTLIIWILLGCAIVLIFKDKENEISKKI